MHYGLMHPEENPYKNHQCDVCFKKLCSGCVTGRNAFSPKCKDCYKKAPPPTPIYADIETYFTSKGCNK